MIVLQFPKLKWFYGELTFGAADLCIQRSYIKIVLDSNFQSISFEQKGWYMSTFGYEFICLNWIISLKVLKMSWTLDGKCRIHARLSNTSYMRVHYWTRGSLRRLYIGKFLSLHFEDRDEGFVSKGSKDILHDNKIFSCTMELPNGSASPVMILFCFVSFSFRTNLWPLF